MRTNENMEVILSTREANYIAGLIDDIINYANGNKENEDEGLWIGKNRNFWATPETCYHMKNLLKTCEEAIDISIYSKEINELERLSQIK